MIVSVLITPGRIDRGAEFPCSFRTIHRNSLLRGQVISIPRKSAVDNQIIIELQQVFLEFRKPPLLCASLPISIEPQKIDLSIIAKHFCQLCPVKFQKSLPGFLVLDSICGFAVPVDSAQILRYPASLINRSIIRMRPVQQGIVNSYLQSCVPHGFYVLF